jgi:hypothetical protein
MAFVIGFAVWLAIAIVAGLIAWQSFRGAGTTMALTLGFAIFGAFIGGMLGISAYVFHNPVPLRLGGIVGAVLGAFFFPFLYHFIARKAV